MLLHKNKSSSISSNSSGGSNDNILIDITVANCNILAAKPAAQFQNNPMPVNEAMKIIWWENINVNRLNKRVFGNLKSRALRKAQRIVNIHGSITLSAEYGSILINTTDFIPFEGR